MEEKRAQEICDYLEDNSHESADEIAKHFNMDWELAKACKDAFLKHTRGEFIYLLTKKY